MNELTIFALALIGLPSAAYIGAALGFQASARREATDTAVLIHEDRMGNAVAHERYNRVQFSGWDVQP